MLDDHGQSHSTAPPRIRVKRIQLVLDEDLTTVPEEAGKGEATVHAGNSRLVLFIPSHHAKTLPMSAQSRKRSTAAIETNSIYGTISLNR